MGFKSKSKKENETAALQNLIASLPKQCGLLTCLSETEIKCCVFDEHSTGNVGSCCQCTIQVYPEVFRLWLLRFRRGLLRRGSCVSSECGAAREAELLEGIRLSSLLSLNLQRCGVVAESHTIDERSEWRTFGDSVRVPRLCPSSEQLQHVPLRSCERASLPLLARGPAKSAFGEPQHSDLKSLECWHISELSHRQPEADLGCCRTKIPALIPHVWVQPTTTFLMIMVLATPALWQVAKMEASHWPGKFKGSSQPACCFSSAKLLFHSKSTITPHCLHV